MSASRRPVLFNGGASRPGDEAPLDIQIDDHLIDDFHNRLPGYCSTDLVRLDEVASKLGVRAVHLKNESSRFGLTSFKILGASWGAFRAIAQKFRLPLGVDLDVVREALRLSPAKLYTATDGNHGCAVARMASILGISAQIHVPSCMRQDVIDTIRAEGAEVLVAGAGGSYDNAIAEAHAASKNDVEGGLLVQDFAFEGYEDIPRWIIDGYSTMMREIDRQLGDNCRPDLVVAPVGVGSFADAVVSHFKRPGKSSGTATKVLTVEPDTSACLYTAMKQGRFGSVPGHTPSIMAGLDCATPSSISWPLLESRVDASVTVSSHEAHQACIYLNDLSISAGPCGAASLAALWRLDDSDKARLGLSEASVVVIFCTEGKRLYDIPHSVSDDDPVALTQTLVRINSANPSLGSVPGPGETEIAHYIAAWLEHRDIETHWIEPIKGRPSVVGVVRGSGGGKSLMFNGHTDTVTVMGYEADPLGGEIRDGRLYGRGAADMKCGVAAALVALAKAKEMRLRGDVIFAGVADEEHASIGTEQVIQAGWRADAAIISEPTDVEILYAHKGFVWFEVDIHGLAAHGSRADLGIDAICMAGYFLVELHKLSRRLQTSAGDATVGPPTLHASIIKGGEEESSYPALCMVTVERRTVPGESVESAMQEIRDILDSLSIQMADFKYNLRSTFQRSPFHLSRDHPFSVLVERQVERVLKGKPTVTGAPYWTDCALLADAGIPALLWGPRGQGLHGKEEWVEVESIKQVASTLTAITAEFCS